jgi:hypothetical protein
LALLLNTIFNYLYPSIQVSEASLSHQTIHRLVVKQFSKDFHTVKKALEEAIGKIHIAFDGARSNNRHAFFGVTAMYLDEGYMMRKITLGIHDPIYQHTGGNITAELINILEAFEIGDKLGYFTLDNASNNDTAVEYIWAAHLFLLGKPPASNSIPLHAISAPVASTSTEPGWPPSNPTSTGVRLRWVG